MKCSKEEEKDNFKKLSFSSIYYNLVFVTITLQGYKIWLLLGFGNIKV